MSIDDLDERRDDMRGRLMKRCCERKRHIDVHLFALIEGN